MPDVNVKRDISYETHGCVYSAVFSHKFLTLLVGSFDP